MGVSAFLVQNNLFSKAVSANAMSEEDVEESLLKAVSLDDTGIQERRRCEAPPFPFPISHFPFHSMRSKQLNINHAVHGCAQSTWI